MLSWLTAGFHKQIWKRLLFVVAITAPRMFLGARERLPEARPSAALASRLADSKVTLRASAKHFAACLSRDDVDLQTFVSASEEFVKSVERFGEFTSRGVSDARKNLSRVRQVAGRQLSSMKALL